MNIINTFLIPQLTRSHIIAYLYTQQLRKFNRIVFNNFIILVIHIKKADILIYTNRSPILQMRAQEQQVKCDIL